MDEKNQSSQEQISVEPQQLIDALGNQIGKQAVQIAMLELVLSRRTEDGAQ